MDQINSVCVLISLAALVGFVSVTGMMNSTRLRAASRLGQLLALQHLGKKAGREPGMVAHI